MACIEFVNFCSRVIKIVLISSLYYNGNLTNTGEKFHTNGLFYFNKYVTLGFSTFYYIPTRDTGAIL